MRSTDWKEKNKIEVPACMSAAGPGKTRIFHPWSSSEPLFSRPFLLYKQQDYCNNSTVCIGLLCNASCAPTAFKHTDKPLLHFMHLTQSRSSTSLPSFTSSSL